MERWDDGEWWRREREIGEDCKKGRRERREGSGMTETGEEGKKGRRKRRADMMEE